MKTGRYSLAFLLSLSLAGPLMADPAKEADLATRVQQLEKRVAELEAAIKKAATDLPKTESENKLMGIWTVTDADRPAAVFVDLVLKSDDRCDVVIRSFGSRANATYKLIGKQLIVEASTASATESWSQCRLVSVDDKELVLEHGEGAASRKVKYARQK